MLTALFDAVVRNRTKLFSYWWRAQFSQVIVVFRVIVLLGIDALLQEFDAADFIAVQKALSYRRNNGLHILARHGQWDVGRFQSLER